MSAVSAKVLRELSVSCLDRWRKQPDFGYPGMALVAVAEWLKVLDDLLVRLDEPVVGEL